MKTWTRYSSCVVPQIERFPLQVKAGMISCCREAEASETTFETVALSVSGPFVTGGLVFV